MNIFFRLAMLAITVRAGRLPITAPAVTRAALQHRQATTALSSAITRTIGYRSVAEDKGETIYSSLIYLDWSDNTASNYMILTTSDSYWGLCYLSSATSSSYYYPPSYTHSCNLWTSVSVGYLMAESGRSIPCVDGYNTYYTDLLYSEWGATNPLTSYRCAVAYTTYSSATSYYIKRPDARVSVQATTPATNPASTTSGSVATQPTSPLPSNMSIGGPVAAPAANNTKVIAGAAVGGIVGLAFAAVAALLVMKHYRYRTKSQGPSTFTQAAYYEDKPPGHGDVPEWVPTPPATSPISNQMIRNDGYHPDSIRNGTTGARSPTH